ncbi:hypothetical protein BESB_036540 [Besnoitia besnoiti]|uniref:Uncharacterized protein n=1 Tax=Besnoitia besnoiti TaxID=94643 RepID=A0A2A9MM85_BESBE|nr:hypothetical protein BESB_036540 [Besnoitia besnoiti]PFH37196.1 hypothetical protein BESB_036540 [Besnoitia besnoiti]
MRPAPPLALVATNASAKSSSFSWSLPYLSASAPSPSSSFLSSLSPSAPSLSRSMSATPAWVRPAGAHALACPPRLLQRPSQAPARRMTCGKQGLAPLSQLRALPPRFPCLSALASSPPGSTAAEKPAPRSPGGRAFFAAASHASSPSFRPPTFFPLLPLSPLGAAFRALASLQGTRARTLDRRTFSSAKRTPPLSEDPGDEETQDSIDAEEESDAPPRKEDAWSLGASSSGSASRPAKKTKGASSRTKQKQTKQTSKRVLEEGLDAKEMSRQAHDAPTAAKAQKPSKGADADAGEQSEEGDSCGELFMSKQNQKKQRAQAAHFPAKGHPLAASGDADDVMKQEKATTEAQNEETATSDASLSPPSPSSSSQSPPPSQDSPSLLSFSETSPSSSLAPADVASPACVSSSTVFFPEEESEASPYSRFACMRRATHEARLKDALERFKAVSKKETASRGRAWRVYEGWPPRSRVPVGDEHSKFGPLQRHAFVFNRLKGTGRKREPTLAICCGNKPVLLLSEPEFEALVEKLPWIKHEMAEFKKLL